MQAQGPSEKPAPNTSSRPQAAGTPWLDWDKVRPFYSEPDIQAMVAGGAIRVEGNRAFLLERWTYTGKEHQTFQAIMTALRKLDWQIEAPARLPHFTQTQAEARLTLPQQHGGAVVYGEFHMIRKSEPRLAAAGGMAFHKASGQPFLQIPKDFDEVGADPDRPHRWDFFVHGQRRTFSASLKDLAAAVATELRSKEEPAGTRRGPEEEEEPYESRQVAMHMDRPAHVDLLGRKAFAETLARRFKRIVHSLETEGSGVRSFDSAFMVHLHAPWGAGKTSVLHLIAEELGNKSGATTPWVVVNFNAWQHQRIDPPWWSLLDTAFRESLRCFRGQPFRRAWLWVAEHYRRLSAGHAHTLLALAIALWIAALVVFFGLVGGSSLSTFWSEAGGWAQNVTAILALAGGVWAGVLGLSRSLLPGSAVAAQGFVRNTNDPMRAVSIHFRRLISGLRRPVIILVDDVDRCDKAFVVRLLEGIQTLFHHPRVIFLVAGDRRWINTCYEGAYPEFVGSIVEPGRRLGALFLEKAFQLSVSLPQLSPERQQEYWEHLLKKTPESIEAREQARATVKAQLEGAHSEREVLDQLTKGGDDPVLSQVIREETVKRLADYTIEASSQHFLERFARLLEPNPRAMKRLVNAYAVYRDIAILSDLDFELDDAHRRKLALWTIVSLRWPTLEEFLVRKPEVADLLADPPRGPNELENVLWTHMTRQESSNADETALVNLMKSKAVLGVFNNPDVGVRLDADAVRRLRSLSSAAGAGAVL